MKYYGVECGTGRFTFKGEDVDVRVFDSKELLKGWIAKRRSTRRAVKKNTHVFSQESKALSVRKVAVEA